MNSTRPPPPIQVYQDPTPQPQPLLPNNKPRPSLQPSAMPLQPVRNPPNRSDVSLNPTTQMQNHPHSPHKLNVPSPPKSNYQNLNYVPIPPPQMNRYTDSPMKRVYMQASQQYQPLPPQIMHRPLFTTFHSNFDAFEHENHPSSMSMLENFADFPEPSYARKPSLKRSYSDVTSTNERPFTRRPDDDLLAIPEPEEMPMVEDDGNKPSYSYAQMIGMAILRAPNRRLTLAQIYDWISSTFAFYREDTKHGWHNSIRHNLSLNKAFKKQERPKGDAGKGSYWVIESGMESMFLRDKIRKLNSNLSTISINPNIGRQDFVAMPQPVPEMRAPAPVIVQSNVPPKVDVAPALPELSSDATLPASDPALNEEEPHEPEPQQQPEQDQPSSPLDAINSSPPIATTRRRTGSSPANRVHQTTSAQRHKRSATTMDDSGYFSSIESSVLRSNKASVVLTSEIDLGPPRKKARGRAEEEIIRIRSSSHDPTPSHNRSVRISSDEPHSSSPARSSPTAPAHPVTPSVFKKPMRPPPSISPNTQLQLHRQAMQDFANSPVKSLGHFGAELDTYSPFKWNDENDFWSETLLNGTPATPAGSSPLKGSIKRPSLLRSNTANILHDISHDARRLNTKTPSKSSMLRPGLREGPGESPLKSSTNNSSIPDDHDALFDFSKFADENSDDGEGLDILQGFQKIGEASTSTSAAAAPSVDGRSRPALARSFTSRF